MGGRTVDTLFGQIGMDFIGGKATDTLVLLANVSRPDGLTLSAVAFIRR